MKSALDRKMDRILERENSGRVKKGIKNRALRKLFANKLSIFGFIIFFLIIYFQIRGMSRNKIWKTICY